MSSRYFNETSGQREGLENDESESTLTHCYLEKKKHFHRKVTISRAQAFRTTKRCFAPLTFE